MLLFKIVKDDHLYRICKGQNISCMETITFKKSIDAAEEYVKQYADNCNVEYKIVEMLL